MFFLSFCFRLCTAIQQNSGLIFNNFFAQQEIFSEGYAKIILLIRQRSQKLMSGFIILATVLKIVLVFPLAIFEQDI
jgi:hypothetical protein